jgi:single-strand DNA-binding protein
MKDVNKVILIGRLGAHPIQRFTKSGYSVVHFPVATSRRVRATPPGELGEASLSPSPMPLEEETQWHQIVVWGKQGEACAQFLRKGSGVFVEGAIRSHRYEAKDGTTRLAFEIHAEDVNFLDRARRKAEIAGEPASEGQESPEQQATPERRTLAQESVPA